MTTIQGSIAFLHLLQQHGITTIFGNPGTTELAMMDALTASPDMRYVLGLQEGAVIGMADGYARASGRIAAVNIHAGPGVGNAMGMLYDVSRSGTPMLVTAGQQAQGFGLTEPTVAADLPPVPRPFVKWSTEVNRVEDLPIIIHRAVKVALSPPRGPVFVSLPADIMEETADLDLGWPTKLAARFRADPDAVEEAAHLLSSAQKPVIIAGDAIAQSDAQTELVRIAEAIGALVYFEGEPSTNAFPTRHPLFKEPIVRLAPSIRRTLEQHDLLFSAGADLFTLSLPSKTSPIPANLPIVHLDPDPWQLGKNFPTHVAVLGDPKTTLPDIETALSRLMTPAQKSQAAQRVKSFGEARCAELQALAEKARALSERSPMVPLALNHAIGHLLPEDSILIDESVTSAAGLRQFLRFDGSDAFHGLRGGGIGWGIPAAIGAKLARPSRPVVALVGDGSAMYTFQALWTASHLKLHVIFVILNNRSYRILKQRLRASGGRSAQANRYIGMELDDPPLDFVSMAAGMGVAGRCVSTIAEFEVAMRAALSGRGPFLIEALTERDFGAG